MIRTVAAVLTDRVAMFELGVAVEVFGIDRTRDGVPPFELRVCSLRPGVPTPATQGVCQVIAPYGLDGVEGADLVIVPAGVGPDDGPRPHLVQALQRAYDAGGFSGGSMDRRGLKALLEDIDRKLVDQPSPA